MARFLNTSATNYYLEELIKQARERLYIISPFLKFNDRIKELLDDKDRMKIDVRLVFGKSELAPQEINWLRDREFIRTSFCQNLHAKCYLNERAAIITSMNLYDFSQVNNNEMGVFIERDSDAELYAAAYEEAQRLFRISEQVRLAADKVDEAAAPSAAKPAPVSAARTPSALPSAPRTTTGPSAPARAGGFSEKLTTSKLAAAREMKTAELVGRLVKKGLVTKKGRELELTEAGKKAGGTAGVSKKFGPYLLWPKDMAV